MAEGGGLLNRYTAKSGIGGSNPPLSASYFLCKPGDSLLYQPGFARIGKTGRVFPCTPAISSFSNLASPGLARRAGCSPAPQRFLPFQTWLSPGFARRAGRASLHPSDFFLFKPGSRQDLQDGQGALPAPRRILPLPTCHSFTNLASPGWARREGAPCTLAIHLPLQT